MSQGKSGAVKECLQVVQGGDEMSKAMRLTCFDRDRSVEIEGHDALLSAPPFAEG